ncbi:helix-turn-helix domain-containing protein [Capnocytophaga sp. G2]|uniref:helix-turn-helix domain-containing protein n=1 Tax=Capnocytophaga sp. G2 TaxID=3110695 RepID=UPI002B49DD7E|nr:helix-turn-helix domain-containing protein [Capnocytophaga sp. G2]MEB3004961.1 helix-turn-helix domain-containing protein [Capnocytophaga sp. G2]
MDIAQYVLNFVNQTHRSIFLTGKAGTGKTTLLQHIVTTTYKNVIVAAPTGIAALNAKGVTLHSLFQLPLATFIPFSIENYPLSENINVVIPKTLIKQQKMNAYKRKMLKKLELLIIDEVSMLRADTLDMINVVLKSVRKSPRPFGGVQVIFIGDLLQLPPVVKPQEWQILQHYYKGIAFFHSKVIEENPPLYLELEKVYRQTDEHFVSILNRLRNNEITLQDKQILQTYLKPLFIPPKKEGYIILTTHNYKADQFNSEAFEEINKKEFHYYAEVKGEFPDYLYPLDMQLTLKVGAQVMFVKNDLDIPRRYYNGKIGEVVFLSQEEIHVKLADEDTIIEVGKYIWEHIRYKNKTNSEEITQEVLGTFTQYPLRLAWAITIHKSQGLTFDKAVIDLEDIFASGQAYVALSRLRTLDGLVLLSSFKDKELHVSSDIIDYASQKVLPESLEGLLSSNRKDFLEEEIVQTFSWLDLAVQWKVHVNSYKIENTQSIKSQFYSWAIEQSKACDTIVLNSEKFVNQLKGILTTPHYDIHFLLERFHKAFDYFFPLLERIAFDTFYTHFQINGKKQGKTFVEELTLLEEMIIEAIVRLLKTKIILESLLDNHQNIEDRKENFEKAKSYKEYLLSRVFEKWKEDSLSGKISIGGLNITKEKKKEKISTYEQTFLLWQQKMSPLEIANKRKLSQKTVYGHLVKFVEEGKIAVTELLPIDKLSQLEEIFPIISREETLTSLKEQVGDSYSWEELRIFRAYLINKNKEKE